MPKKGGKTVDYHGIQNILWHGSDWRKKSKRSGDGSIKKLKLALDVLSS
jgi:hypothetical protein